MSMQMTSNWKTMWGKLEIVDSKKRNSIECTNNMQGSTTLFDTGESTQEESNYFQQLHSSQFTLSNANHQNASVSAV